MASQSIAREATIFVALFGGLWILQIVAARALRRKRERTNPDRPSIGAAHIDRHASDGIASVSEAADDGAPPPVEIRPQAAIALGPAVEPAVSS